MENFPLQFLGGHSSAFSSLFVCAQHTKVESVGPDEVPLSYYQREVLCTADVFPVCSILLFVCHIADFAFILSFKEREMSNTSAFCAV